MPIRLLGMIAVMSPRLQMFIPQFPRGIYVWGVFGILVEFKKLSVSVETILGEAVSNTASFSSLSVSVEATLA